LQSRLGTPTWFGINEGLMRRIFDYSLLKQHPKLRKHFNSSSQAQMITGLAFPQPADSELLHDVRFAGMRMAQAENEPASIEGAGKDQELQALFLLLMSKDPDRAALLSAAVAVVGRQLGKQLRLPEVLDPARQLLQYGMDSLAAVELRNWVRSTLRIELTTLDVVNASSLTELCRKVVGKMAVSSKD
jgi:fumagillin biosynthesis polyketide synthase